ncbi:hypothetical protein [uncultured Tateyamaria sp.]|uniref:hypothetical protein n=1 Tax=uncultured Tateyamaria sp. TaxID=455651 RepID=UPI0026207831|nr:hypothetical protein [uncultured Tateyamaria sp.]
MKPAQHTHDRVLARRNARARRSRWLGRALWSLTGIGLMSVLRLYPEATADALAYLHDVPPRTTQATLTQPETVEVRHMPRDTVPVRRAGALALTGPDPVAPQTQANTLGQTLRDLKPGG